MYPEGKNPEGKNPEGKNPEGKNPEVMYPLADLSTLWMYPERSFAPTSFDVFFTPSAPTLFLANAPKHPITLAFELKRSLETEKLKRF